MTIDASGLRPDEGTDGDTRLIESLFAVEATADPYPLYRTVEVPGCRYAAAAAMLKDPRFRPPELGFEDSPELMWRVFARFMLNLDGERHARVRQKFARVFTPRRVEQYRPTITAKAEALIGRVIQNGRMDAVADYARPLPFSIISTVVGVPEDRHGWLAERTLILDTAFARQREPAYVARASVAVQEMTDYMATLLDERALTPQDDLLSLLAADMPDEPSAREDLVANCVFFIIAGHITTTSLIAGGLILLLEHPDQLALLRADATLWPAAIEEMLRLISPITIVWCRARQDITTAGYEFAASDQRVVFLAGANRDADEFRNPDVFDIKREPNHLAFSAGNHYCLGAPLARLHGEIALRVLLDRLVGLRLEGEPVWLGSFPLREPAHVPVTWQSPVADSDLERRSE